MAFNFQKSDQNSLLSQWQEEVGCQDNSLRRLPKNNSHLQNLSQNKDNRNLLFNNNHVLRENLKTGNLDILLINFTKKWKNH